MPVACGVACGESLICLVERPSCVWRVCVGLSRGPSLPSVCFVTARRLWLLRTPQLRGLSRLTAWLAVPSIAGVLPRALALWDSRGPARRLWLTIYAEMRVAVAYASVAGTCNGSGVICRCGRSVWRSSCAFTAQLRGPARLIAFQRVLWFGSGHFIAA